MLESNASPEFWRLYNFLPADIRLQADKQFKLFMANPDHPSLHLKRAGAFWTARVSRGYRAVARRQGDRFFWFWIGPHGEYDRLLKG